MLAEGDLLNQLASERRHQRRRETQNVVELDQLAGNHSWADGSPLTRLVRDEDLARDQAVLGRIRQGCTPQEQQVLDLMLADEHSTAVFAAVLGLAERSQDEQERVVKRYKDRLKKRLSRGATPYD
jgi:hypothetical protein